MSIRAKTGTSGRGTPRVPPPSGGGGAGQPLTHVIFVDGGIGDDTTGDGSIDKPYKTIQKALDTIPAATTAAESKQVFVVEISPGDYDEDLAINIAGKRIILSSWGPWGLGTFNALDWAPSGTRRNITISGAGAAINGIRPAFGIGNHPYIAERASTHQSYFTGARISGQILVTATGLLEIDLEAEVFGTTGTSAGVSFDSTGSNPIIQCYLYNGRYRGRFLSGTNLNFQHAEKVRFDGLLSVPNYSLIDRCRLNAGMTTLSAANAGLFPDGIINTFFAPGTTFTGPALSLRLDAYTNYWFKTGGCVLAGGATKVILGDLVP